MRVIYMCVANINDRLPQGAWVHLTRLINTEVLQRASRVHFSGFAGWLADTQKASWVFETFNLGTEQGLHDALTLILKEYDVPITWSVLGPVEFIRP